MKIEFMTKVEDDPDLIEWNDGKWNANIDLDAPLTPEEVNKLLTAPGDVKRVWVRLQSTDPAEAHAEIHELLGHKVRVTIETVD